ncbi:RNA 2',3'-cyclic phosphodiesterase [Pengzhenrongella sicca]|uniref:RNA 2',3'-cyclic phosphodiesterase n=1 Tax=Pengzhenrongella sicca TaxID=2819238 RepID=A0A8A4ZI86_9MICO|nr:RNA 2',3'-cyclic phosphodiesterase [Pengzhenrongella sicca]QTE30689.1 RNA 2',3'-cyclic phosphodiesterase [Pengzhenrongella sicca]
MRLFVAVRPPATVRAHLDRALDLVRGGPDLGDSRRSLRWAAPEDRHLTLAFYGEVSAGAGEELIAGVAAIAGQSAPLEVHLRGAGVFDRRVLWIGCGGHVSALAALSARCVELGEEVSGRADRRVRSRAHLTVARVTGRDRARLAGRSRRPDAEASSADDVATLAHALAVYEGPTWRVEDVVVFSSRPGEGRGGGPAYDEVATFALRDLPDPPPSARL